MGGGTKSLNLPQGVGVARKWAQSRAKNRMSGGGSKEGEVNGGTWLG